MKTTVNPRCDGSHCTEENGAVKLFPLGGGSNGILCLSCWAHENKYRYERGKETGRPEDWPQLNWFDAPMVPDDFE